MTHNEYRETIAHNVLLPGEKKEELFLHMNQFEETFVPRTPLEQFLTGEMATNFFRQMRATLLERLIFQLLMEEHVDISPERGLGYQVAHACKSLALAPNAVDMVGRWQTRYHKLLRSNIRLFLEVRKQLGANPDREQSPPDPRASIYTAPVPNTTGPNNGAPESC